jgi:hypothetical protein
VGSFNGDLPAEFGRIVPKACQKDRDVRHRNAGDVRADLKRLSREAGSGSVRSGQAQAATLLW